MKTLYTKQLFKKKNIKRIVFAIILSLLNIGMGRWTGYAFYTAYLVTKGTGYFFLINTVQKITSLWISFGLSCLIALLIDYFIIRYAVKIMKKNYYVFSICCFLAPLIKNVWYAINIASI